MAATQQAVETAIRNGEKMHGKYAVIPALCVPGVFYVQHKEDVNRTYLVNTNKGRERCDCEQWKREEACKHQWFVAETKRIEAGEEMANLMAEGIQ